MRRALAGIIRLLGAHASVRLRRGGGGTRGGRIGWGREGGAGGIDRRFGTRERRGGGEIGIAVVGAGEVESREVEARGGAAACDGEPHAGGRQHPTSAAAIARPERCLSHPSSAPRKTRRGSKAREGLTGC